MKNIPLLFRDKINNMTVLKDNIRCDLCNCDFLNDQLGTVFIDHYIKKITICCENCADDYPEMREGEIISFVKLDHFNIKNVVPMDLSKTVRFVQSSNLTVYDVDLIKSSETVDNRSLSRGLPLDEIADLSKRKPLLENKNINKSEK